MDDPGLRQRRLGFHRKSDLPISGEKYQLGAPGDYREFGLMTRKPQNSVVSRNWHGSCNPVFIRRKGRWNETLGDL
jgi:hypothetical protein